jgi:superfamily II DNA/RNA helicase
LGWKSSRALRIGSGPEAESSPHQKLVIFTEQRDTLNCLERQIRTLFGREDAIVTIHGSMGREDRRKAQKRFLHDPDVRVLLATDQWSRDRAPKPPAPSPARGWRR